VKVILLGNAGAGKRTLSRLMIAKQPADRLSVDEVAFNGGAERRPLQGNIEEVRH
jgi:adenylate kinase family enzyme